MSEYRLLYLSYTGMTESLGQSQVLSYQKRIAKNNSVHLFSFERRSVTNQLKNEIDDKGIQWTPFKSANNKFLRCLTLVYFALFSLFYIKKNKIDIIHCRSFFMALVGLFCSIFTNVRFVYDIRGFWVHELVENNRLKNKYIKKILLHLQGYLLKKADQIVTLTESSVPYLEMFSKSKILGKVTVIPTCVDLERFNVDLENCRSRIKISYVGNTQERYQFDKVLYVMDSLKKLNKNIELEIVTQDINAATEALTNNNYDPQDFKVFSLDFSEMPKYLHSVTAAVFFMNETLTTKAMAPTKFGEFLACGVYPIVNDNGSDVPRIVRENHVGFVIDPIKIDIEQLYENILSSQTNEIKNRSFNVAKKYFDVEVGSRRLNQIYESFKAEY
ncbi:hypothetical protein BCS95_15075 [Vibrio breoganii]|uniref:glycosyltransferase n=1 Tax=Vibrio breoganii TaxID=553239 RepID=UPI000CC50CCF|nr:glycosyltransferase [Vibrio breoganii]PMP00967.1 hypothetical protein BCS95_15075 [Vibrio breoganii]